jgi:hypothetical protein
MKSPLGAQDGQSDLGEGKARIRVEEVSDRNISLRVTVTRDGYRFLCGIDQKSLA